MPIVTLDIVPELMTGDRAEQYQQIAAGITEAIVSTGAPAESVHVLINEVSDAKYSVGGVTLRDGWRASRPVTDEVTLRGDRFSTQAGRPPPGSLNNDRLRHAPPGPA